MLVLITTNLPNLRKMNSTEATTSIVSEMRKVITIKEEQISIEPEKVDLVAGNKKSNKKRLEEIYGAEITLLTIGGSEIVIKEPAAKKDNEESIYRSKPASSLKKSSSVWLSNLNESTRSTLKG